MFHQMSYHLFLGNVVDGGLSYNVGDPVLITAGGFSRNATAQVASVGTVFAANGQIVDSGAGFKTGGLLSGGDDANGFILYSITNQDTTGNNTPNTFVLMGQTYDSAPSDNTAQTYANLLDTFIKYIDKTNYKHKTSNITLSLLIDILKYKFPDVIISDNNIIYNYKLDIV